MARTLVIDSIEAVGRTFKSGEKLFIDPKLKKFMDWHILTQIKMKKFM